MRFVPRPHLRLGLLGTFALASAVPVLLLGLALATVLGNQIRSRSTNSTVQGVEFATQAGLSGIVSGDLAQDQRLDPVNEARLQAAIASQHAMKFARVNIWSADRQLLYSTKHELIGTHPTPSDELLDVLGGEENAVETLHPSQRLTTEQDNADILKQYGSLLEVYVPITQPGKSRAVGAFEVYIPDAPLAASIAGDTRNLDLVLILGLGLLYAVLFRMVMRAARKLDAHADELGTDSLTGLPNRTLFQGRGVDALEASAGAGERVALLLIDLDRFKEINDTLGHHTGDLLLQAITPRIQQTLGPAQTLARLGGDEFGVLVPHLPDPQSALFLARGIHKVLEQPFGIQGVTLDVEASIGIACFPDHAADFDQLMQHADVAMYTAKGKRTGYELYEPGAAGADASRLQLAGDLRNAQPRRQLEMHYQPKVSLADGRVVGAEALMRWHHPEHGLMMPDQFIPLAERSGLIRSLTLFALDAAVREAARWFSAGIELAVSVNLSTRDLIDIQLPDEIERMLGTWRVPPSRLELEITESVLMADPERAAAVLEQLSRLGVKISIDDFGSGYSSLGYLKRLHVSDLKIDKSFVLNMTESEGDATIVKSTIDMAHNLGLGVVAEGVETQAVYDRLRTMGCDAAQGFLLSRPVSDDALLAWVRDRVGGTRPVAA